MTREEAIHIVNVAFSVPQAIRRSEENRTYFEDEIREAKRMAIKALEQELCDKCEVGNPCLYCKHEFEPQESGDKE